MAISCSFSPSSPKIYQTTNATVSGAVAATAYTLTLVNPAGHTQIARFTTDGGGGAVVPIVPSITGTYTWNIYPVAPVSGANGSFNTSGH